MHWKMGMRWKTGGGVFESKCTESGEYRIVGVVMIKKDELNTWRVIKCNKICKVLRIVKFLTERERSCRNRKEKTGKILPISGCSWRYWCHLPGFNISR